LTQLVLIYEKFRTRVFLQPDGVRKLLPTTLTANAVSPKANSRGRCILRNVFLLELMLVCRSSSSSKRNMNDDGNMMHLMQGVHLNDPTNAGMYANDDMYAQNNGLVSGGSFQNNSSKMLQANAS
jgi:hypothetical protein